MRAPIFPRRRAFAELVAELEDARATAWGAQDELSELRRANRALELENADLKARIAHKRKPARPKP